MPVCYQCHPRDISGKTWRKLRSLIKQKEYLLYTNATILPKWTVTQIITSALGLAVWLAMAAQIFHLGFGDTSHSGFYIPFFSARSVLVIAPLVIALVMASRSVFPRIFLSVKRGVKPGEYLLHYQYVTVQPGCVRIYDLTHLSSADAIHEKDGQNEKSSGLKLQFRDSSATEVNISLPGKDLEFAQLLAYRLNWGLRQLDPKTCTVEPHTMDHADPFKNTDSYKFSGKNTYGTRTFALPVFAALVTAVVAGAHYQVLKVRNEKSDMAAYLAAKKERREAPYVRYIHKRGAFYLELDKELPDVAFEEARAKNSPQAMRQLLKRYPSRGLNGRVANEMHRLYANVYQQYLNKVALKYSGSGRGKSAEKPIKMLLDRVEALPDPGVRIKFVAGQKNDFVSKTIDELISTGGFSAKTTSAHLVRYYEGEIAESLKDEFNKIIPDEYLTVLRPGDTYENDIGIIPELVIGHAMSVFGVYKMEDAPIEVLGVSFKFDMSYVSTNDCKDFSILSFELKPPPSFMVPNPNVSLDSPEFIATVYNRMFSLAYEGLYAGISKDLLLDYKVKPNRFHG